MPKSRDLSRPRTVVREPVADTPPPPATDNSKLWIALLATVLGLAATSLSPVLFLRFLPASASGGTDSVIPLSVMAFAGVVGLLITLTLMACAFSALEITDKEQALGLPEGSIRAVIALSLIVIFVISSLFLFGRLAQGEKVDLPKLTADQVADIPGAELVSKTSDDEGKTFTVTRRIGPTRAGEDFSRQFLTTISTLVVAIASFYFGSKAVQSGQAAMSEFAKQPIRPEEGGGEKPGGEKPDQKPGGGDGSEESSEPTKPADPQPEAPVANQQLSEFLGKRIKPADVPESSGVLEHGSSGSVQLAAGAAAASSSSAAALAVGNITADHWLSTAQRERIGRGDELEPVFLVIHYTEGYGADGSISGWRDRSNGVLAHVVVDRDGKIFQCRPFNQECGHAGKGRWRYPETNALTTDLNGHSIGIEIANTGDGGDDHLHSRLNKHYPQAQIKTATHRNAEVKGSNAAEHKRTQWEEYPQAQLDAVFGLVKLLMAKYKMVDITGHDCIAYDRKTDPGPLFPMDQLRSENGLKGPPTVWDEKGNPINV